MGCRYKRMGATDLEYCGRPLHFSDMCKIHMFLCTPVPLTDEHLLPQSQAVQGYVSDTSRTGMPIRGYFSEKMWELAAEYVPRHQQPVFMLVIVPEWQEPHIMCGLRTDTLTYLYEVGDAASLKEYLHYNNNIFPVRAHARPEDPHAFQQCIELGVDTSRLDALEVLLQSKDGSKYAESSSPLMYADTFLLVVERAKDPKSYWHKQNIDAIAASIVDCENLFGQWKPIGTDFCTSLAVRHRWSILEMALREHKFPVSASAIHKAIADRKDEFKHIARRDERFSDLEYIQKILKLLPPLSKEDVCHLYDVGVNDDSVKAIRRWVHEIHGMNSWYVCFCYDQHEKCITGGCYNRRKQPYDQHCQECRISGMLKACIQHK